MLNWLDGDPISIGQSKAFCEADTEYTPTAPLFFTNGTLPHLAQQRLLIGLRVRKPVE